MLIQVHYADNRFDYVKADMLHGMIESSGIVGFRRSSGWVTVGVDPLRQVQRDSNCKPVMGATGLIQVKYNDNRYDFVTSTTLDALLDSNKVAKFKRASGWATVGADSLRKSRRERN